MVDLSPGPSSSAQSFAKVFASYHEQYSEAGPSSQLDTPIRYDVVLDEEGGLVTSLMGCLEDNIRSRMAVEGELTDELKKALLDEHRSWQLIRAVYDNRLHRADPSFAGPSAKAHLVQNPYSSPEELTQMIVNEDSELSLLATLVDHLQSRPLLNTPPPLEARHGYLPSTIRRAKASHLANPRQLPSLDPDFTLRDPHGPGLAGEDQTYQNPLLETLWDLIRHGELDQALRVCEEGGESWRAATLIGGRRWSMGGMTRGSIAGPLEGNRTRNLWKKSCRAIANNPTLSAAERRLYGALISDLPTLLPACETWEDHLWAHTQAMMESRIDQKWHELAGFWEEEEERHSGGSDGSRVIRGGVGELFSRLEETGRDDVHAATLDPYRVAQRLVVQDRPDLLLSQFANRIPELDDLMSPELIPPLIRFFAHLVLLFRTLKLDVPDSAANAIIESYLTTLKAEGNDGLVAMYAACLREGSGEESYARFLQGMDPNATREQKAEALNRAKQHNLDIAAIVTQTVRMILEEAFSSIPSLIGDQPDPTHLRTGLDERDVHLIRSIEWLTMVSETADEALLQSNAVARYFLALGQTHAAQFLFRSLPASISTTAEDEDEDFQALEHDHFQQLFGVYACHDIVDEVLARSPKTTATKMEQHQWRKNLISAIDKTENATINLLTCDWLIYDLNNQDDEQRSAELHRIRQIFIPDLTMRLHDLLVTHQSHHPVFLQRALDLCKVVASEEYHVYEEFFGHGGDPYRLEAYLGKVREASLGALQSGSGSAFVVKV